MSSTIQNSVKMERSLHMEEVGVVGWGKHFLTYVCKLNYVSYITEGT